MKMSMVTALFVLLVLLLSGCKNISGGKESSSFQSSTEPTVSSATTQVANPFITVQGLDEAATAAGFSFDTPVTVDGKPRSAFYAIPGKMIDVRYGESTDEITLRKSKDTEDNSGDYTEYTTTESITENGVTAIIKGNGESVSTACWTNDGFSYSVHFTAPVTKENVRIIMRKSK